MDLINIDWIYLHFISNAYGYLEQGEGGQGKHMDLVKIQNVDKKEDEEEKEKQQGLHHEKGWK